MKKEFSNYFDWVYEKVPELSAFNLSHDFKFSCEAGVLVPILCKEMLPGDAFKFRASVFCRLAPMLAPVMHEVNVKTNWFFVPNRLIWDDWEDFITPAPNQDNNPSPVAPYFPTLDSTVGSLANYLGVPLGSWNKCPISSLPFRAYNKIWNDWFRDENLQEELDIPTTSGEDTSTPTNLLRRAWEKDLFTAATPKPLRGDDVVIPITGTGVLEYVPNRPTVLHVKEVGSPGGVAPQFVNDLTPTHNGLTNSNVGYAVDGHSPSDVATPTALMFDNPGGSDAKSWHEYSINVSNNHTVNITSNSVTVSQLRTAERLQQWFEKQMRGGSRYIEQILAHFGVESPDSRLQRSEYIGGNSQIVQMSEVINNTSSIDSAPLGDYAGRGISADVSGYERFFATEHGFIICLLSIMPRTSYFQGLDPMFSRADKFDYFWPLFEHLGDEAIKNKRLYLTNDESYNEDTFGYNERYADYKYYPNRVAGEFADNLTFFHLARKFDNKPNLNGEFISCVPRTDIFAVEQNVHHYYIDAFFDITAIRPMKHHPQPKI